MMNEIFQSCYKLINVVNLSLGGLYMTTNDWLIQVLGGIAIFVLGIKFLSEGIKKVTGNRLRRWLSTYNVHPIVCVVIGIIITVLFQNSTGALILLIGLMNANLLNLRQGIGMVVGINLGTILTIYIVGFQIDHYSLLMILIGVILFLFVHHRRTQYFGQLVIGFGFMFYGLSVLQTGLSVMRDGEGLVSLVVELANNPILAILGGIIFTALTTSSNTSIGIVQSLSFEGIIQLKHAVPMLIGSNMGTIIIAIIAVTGANIKAKRVVFVHALYHVIAAFVVLLLQKPIIDTIQQMQFMSVKLQIATVNAAYHLLLSIVFILLIPVIDKITTALVQADKVTSEVVFKPQFLDKRFLSSSSIAINQAINEIVRMGVIAREVLSHASTYFYSYDAREAALAMKKEELVNTLDHQITQYIVGIHQTELTEQQSLQVSGLHHVVNDIERIGDHAENIVELADYVIENKYTFSDEAMNQLRIMINASDYVIARAVFALENQDRSAAADVLGLEADLDRMELEYRRAHFKRLNNGLCRGEAGAIFLDFLSNLERIGDHSKNIAEFILRES